ncbi:MAG: signal recognition particle-docking protein FtsY, partial [Betaproteobacteria bacterium]|nr:signal recognition particle-docking protein FtsY [Betaproteobacteria bacterium]
MFGFFRRLKSVFTPSPTSEGQAAQAPEGTVEATPEVPAVSPTASDLAPIAQSASPIEQQEARKPEADAAPGGWFARLKGGLAKTRHQLADLFGVVKIDEQLLEDLEIALIQADAGVAASESLINALRQAIKQDKLKDGQAVRYCLRDLIRDRLIPLQGGIDLDRSTPLVMMIAGVNGAGKTTSIGKLARHVQREGKTVLLAAGDTFRAAHDGLVCRSRWSFLR